MNYAQLRAFHAVAVTGSFTGAADKLCLTQPAITLQLKALQQHYGLTLLCRRGHQIELTEAGEALYTLTKRLFSVVREIDDYLISLDTMSQGHLTIGADSPFHVMKLMAEFRKAYPGLTLSLSLGNTEEVRDQILDYQTDVAVVAKFEANPRISMVPYNKSPLVVVVSKEHPWVNRRSIKIGELDGVTMVQRELGSATRACFEKALKESGVSPKISLEVDTREAIREAVAQNMGISIVQESEIGHDFRLHTIAISDKRIALEEYVIFLKEKKQSRIVSTFVELVKMEVTRLQDSSIGG